MRVLLEAFHHNLAGRWMEGRLCNADDKIISCNVSQDVNQADLAKVRQL